jgi:hypothetical protein
MDRFVGRSSPRRRLSAAVDIEGGVHQGDRQGSDAGPGCISFTPCPPRIHFTVDLPEREADWWFEQRLVDGGFVAALGLRRPASLPVKTQWTAIDPAELAVQKY